MNTSVGESWAKLIEGIDCEPASSANRRVRGNRIWEKCQTNLNNNPLREAFGVGLSGYYKVDHDDQDN